METQDWRIYTGTGDPRRGTVRLPKSPPWRAFKGGPPVTRTFARDPHDQQRLGARGRGGTYQAGEDEIDLVNLALYLRRPLLITGKPGTGKSSLPYSVARELKLGPVLRWPITSKTTLKEGLYTYDAIGRLQAATFEGGKVPEIGEYLRLGPLGTALLPSRRPRVLLIDEIDKSDLDFPNDLLNVFEEGEFTIPELFRLRKQFPDGVDVLPSDGDDPVRIVDGRVRCLEFPFVVLTSNREREFPPPFLRRCLRLTLQPPSRERLAQIVESHLLEPDEDAFTDERKALQNLFLDRRQKGDLATDQLLNAVFLLCRAAAFGQDPGKESQKKDRLREALMQYLTEADAE